MPPVSVELKKQIKAANDIVDVVSNYLAIAAAGKVFKAVCPFHNDTRPSLQIDRTYQNFRCWSCDAQGDVIDFVMRFEKLEFGEALRLLAERAGIALEAAGPQDEARSRLLRVMKWAEEKYRACLLQDPQAEAARAYLGERRLNGLSVRQFGLGFAPLAGDWLVRAAHAEKVEPASLLELGLIAARQENQGGFYDRFRDRVMFPIRDIRGQTVGFGGRILPSSPYAARGPKYYNSCETPLFSKSHLLFGLDLARHAGTAAGEIAVVEGYTDVMMAHQCGIAQVVATMGTALTAAHVQQLRRYAPRVVLVYDADQGGLTGVDRALELFISQDIELRIALLPDGLDPCDLLTQPGGPERFRQVLGQAQDALDFKLNSLLARDPAGGVEGQRRIVDAVLGVMAMAPPMPSQAGQVRQELIVSRLVHRFGLRQDTVWARLSELKAERRRQQRETRPAPANAARPTGDAASPAPAPHIERQLLQLLLADPALVARAAEEIHPEQLTHPGLRRMLSELYSLQDAGQPADLDGLRVRLSDRPDWVQVAEKLQFVGRQITEHPEWLRQVLNRFQQVRADEERRALKDQLCAGPQDDAKALEILQKLQQFSRAAPVGPTSNT